jgi:hypothetical protein
MSTDVEDLLRRTYADVAERTTVTHVGDAAVVPLASRRRGSWLRPTLAAAALLALVVSGLVVIAGRSDDRAADTGDLVHAVPSWIPQLGPEGSMRPMRLSAIESSDTVDSLTWSADPGSVTLRTERSAAVGVAGGRPAVASDGDGLATGSPLRWIERTGLELEVAWTGGLPATEIETFVRGIVLVTPDQWRALTARGGFRDEHMEEITRFRIDAEADFDVGLVGDLHSGLSLEMDNLGMPVAVIDRCYATATTTDDPATTGYVVVTPQQTSEVIVTADGETHQIAMTPLGPAVPLSVGGLVLERPVTARYPDCTEVR